MINYASSKKTYRVLFIKTFDWRNLEISIPNPKKKVKIYSMPFMRSERRVQFLVMEAVHVEREVYLHGSSLHI